MAMTQWDHLRYIRFHANALKDQHFPEDSKLRRVMEIRTMIYGILDRVMQIENELYGGQHGQDGGTYGAEGGPDGQGEHTTVP
jgi:hypothetical protein